VSGELDVGGRRFSDLPARTREEFLKYEVPVIDFDLEANDERLKDIFKRLNRTFYALSTIEKIASEYSSSQFLLAARVLSGDFSNASGETEFEFEEDLLPEVAIADAARQEQNAFLVDPGVDVATLRWLNERADGPFSQLISNEQVFSYYEAQRKVPLMFVLNVLSTLIGGYYNRNARVKEMLERHNSEFPQADDLITKLNRAADYIGVLEIEERSMWWNKANFFTLVVEVTLNLDRLLDPEQARVNLHGFSVAVPDGYLLAAREAVNNRNQRLTRARHVREAITGLDQEAPADLEPQLS
jgi:hypothetical protein